MRLVTIGGGKGTAMALEAGRRLGADLDAVVAMSDSGGSAGRLRAELGVPAFGDARRALLALSRADPTMTGLFEHRFAGDRLEPSEGVGGHSFGNLVLAALYDMTGSAHAATRSAADLLATVGGVIPASESPTTVAVRMEDGEVLWGEHHIWQQPHDAAPAVIDVKLEPPVAATPAAIDAILQADVVLVAPGALYSSLLPVLLVEGMAEALRATDATVIQVLNLVTEIPATRGYCASDVIERVQAVIGESTLDYLVAHAGGTEIGLPPDGTDGEPLVLDENDVAAAAPLRIVRADLASQQHAGRHDPAKLASVLGGLLGLAPLDSAAPR